VDVLLAVNVALLVAGQFMEPSSIILILAPLRCLSQVVGHRSHPPRRDHDGEHGDRHDPSAGRVDLFVASHIARMGMTEVSIACLPGYSCCLPTSRW